jgi:hypothetical protein
VKWVQKLNREKCKKIQKYGEIMRKIEKTSQKSGKFEKSKLNIQKYAEIR